MSGPDANGNWVVTDPAGIVDHDTLGKAIAWLESKFGVKPAAPVEPPVVVEPPAPAAEEPAAAEPAAPEAAPESANGD